VPAQAIASQLHHHAREGNSTMAQRKRRSPHEVERIATPASHTFRPALSQACLRPTFREFKCVTGCSEAYVVLAVSKTI